MFILVTTRLQKGSLLRTSNHEDDLPSEFCLGVGHRDLRASSTMLWTYVYKKLFNEQKNNIEAGIELAIFLPLC
jgi:hypothetical protein